MEWSGTYAPEGAEFLYLDTVLLFVMYTTIINKIQIQYKYTRVVKFILMEFLVKMALLLQVRETL